MIKLAHMESMIVNGGDCSCICNGKIEKYKAFELIDLLDSKSIGIRPSEKQCLSECSAFGYDSSSCVEKKLDTCLSAFFTMPGSYSTNKHSTSGLLALEGVADIFIKDEKQ